jgi:hypothetical protein
MVVKEKARIINEELERSTQVIQREKDSKTKIEKRIQ